MFPLIAPPTEKPQQVCADEAEATPPLDESATLGRAPGAHPQTSTSGIRLQLSGVALVSTRIFVVVIGEKTTFFQTLLLPDTLPPGTVA